MRRPASNALRKEQWDRASAAIAAGQFGVIGLDQAREIGMTRDAIHDRVRAGRCERVLPGVYRLAGAPATWHQRVMAAVLWAPEAALSHESAAELWSIEGFHPGPVVLSTSRGRKPAAPWITIHRTVRLDRADIAALGPFRLTNPARTIADLCGTLDRDRVEPALEDVLRRGLSSLPRLRWTGRRLGGRGRPGARLFDQLLDERAPGWVPPESELESLLGRLLRRADLPRPVPQFEIRERGRLLARVDFAYPEVKLAIEADGYRYHYGRVVWERDRVRRNALTSRGWRILHVTWEGLETRPDDVVAEIRVALREH